MNPQAQPTRGEGGSELVPTLLQEYGDITRVALTKYLHPKEPQRHLYSLVADYPRRGGRMLRPSLCIATARAFGSDLGDALHSAVALELLHNAFLVHDDVEDGSEERRGRPTLHATHGIPIAVNVGDALALLSFQALIDSRKTLGLSLTMRILEETQRMAQETVEGQAIELGWRRDNAVHLDDGDYLRMTLKKTCWYTAIFPSRVGALIGTRDTVDLERFVRFGFFLGAAFQIQDDLLNLTGERARYGKELGGDLSEGKRTLILLHLLRSAQDHERIRITELLALPRIERSTTDIDWVLDLMNTYGSIDYARQVAHGLAGAALHEFSLTYGDLPDSRDKRFIEALPSWVLARA